MTLMDGLEAYICVILTVEFWYDYWYNTRENRIKRRKANGKKEVVKPILREGTSNVPKKAEGEVRNLPKASNDVQAEIEPGSQS